MTSPQLSLTAIVGQFRDAMAAAGLPYHGPINADAEKVSRFTVEGDRPKSMTGWYVLYTDGKPAGRPAAVPAAARGSTCRPASAGTSAEACARDGSARGRHSVLTRASSLSTAAHLKMGGFFAASHARNGRGAARFEWIRISARDTWQESDLDFRHAVARPASASVSPKLCNDFRSCQPSARQS